MLKTYRQLVVQARPEHQRPRWGGSGQTAGSPFTVEYNR